MVDRRVLLRYGRALFDLAEEKSIVDEIGNDLTRISLGLEQDSDIRGFLTDPMGSVSQKRELVSKWLAEGFQDLTRDFADMVIERGRVGVLLEVTPIYRELLEGKRQRVRAEVVSARPLSDSLRANLSSELSKVTGQEVEIEESVDESLIGGVKIILGNRLYDGSVQRRLDDLGRRLSEAKLN